MNYYNEDNFKIYCKENNIQYRKVDDSEEDTEIETPARETGVPE